MSYFKHWIKIRIDSESIEILAPCKGAQNKTATYGAQFENHLF